MNKLGPESYWSDYGLTIRWNEHQQEFARLPKLRVREDVFAQTGAIPVRTGVYFCADDPNASLQFAWTGGGGKLLESSTFNKLGEAALAAVGQCGLLFHTSARKLASRLRRWWRVPESSFSLWRNGLAT